MAKYVKFTRSVGKKAFDVLKLSKKPMTSEQIATAMDLDARSAAMILSRLKHQGEVASAPIGCTRVWFLPGEQVEEKPGTEGGST
jgi:Mn-dependent DtxR family transcriptional regulator